MLPDVIYGNSLDDSYCTEMQKAALLMYAIYPFQKCKCTHYCMWDIDWKRLDMIHSYFSGLTKKIKNTLQRHCEIEKKKKYGHKGENKNEKVHCQNW